MTLPAPIPVMLARGSSERFWPPSRRPRPRPFLTMDETGHRPPQATCDRLARLSSTQAVMIVAGSYPRTQGIKKVVRPPRTYPALEHFA